jgi:hypothetical protein
MVGRRIPRLASVDSPPATGPVALRLAAFGPNGRIDRLVLWRPVPLATDGQAAVIDLVVADKPYHSHQLRVNMADRTFTSATPCSAGCATPIISLSDTSRTRHSLPFSRPVALAPE